MRDITPIIEAAVNGASTLSTDLTGANNDLLFVAKTAGIAGNNVSLCYLDPGAPSQALSVSVAGSAITVNLATNSAGAITSTATQVKEAIEASVNASALVYVFHRRGNDGTGVVTAMAQTYLAWCGANIIWALEFDFGGSLHYLATRAIPADVSHDGNAYEARLVSVGEFAFQAGDNDKTTDITAVNDGYFTDLVDAGVVLEQGRVWAHLIFPDLDVDPEDRVIEKFWHGRVKAVKDWSRASVTFETAFGFLELNRRALRRYESACRKLIGSTTCPYAPLEGRGLPQPTVTGTVDSVAGLTLNDAGTDFTTDLNGDGAEYAFCYNPANQDQVAVGVIDSVADGSLTVDEWRLGTPAAGWNYICGAPYAACAGARGDCIARGMFGPSETHVAGLGLNKHKRRFFGALAPCSKAAWQSHAKGSWWKLGLLTGGLIGFLVGKLSHRAGKAYSHIPADNLSLEGRTIPVRVGNVAVQSLDLLALDYDNEFIYGLYCVGVGRMGAIHELAANGDPSDFDGRDPNSAWGVKGDAKMAWGFYNEDEGAVAAGELTSEQYRMAIGSRESRSLERYAYVDDYVGNPHVFADVTSGVGPSLDNLAVVAVRREPAGGVKTVEQTISGVFGGVWVKKPSGDTWTYLPDVAELAYWFLRNPAWGAGMTDDELDLESFTAASVFCRELITSTQLDFPTLVGNVGFAPADCRTVPIFDDSWIWVSDIDLSNYSAYNGGKLTINGHDYTVVGINPMTDLEVHAHFGGGYDIYVPTNQVGLSGYQVRVGEPWQVEPHQGDGFTLAPNDQVPRFMANGNLIEEGSVGKLLEAILKNCAGTYIQNNGKLELVIRKAEDLEEINARPAFTDKGEGRNIIFRDGQSTARWDPDPVAESFNAVTVRFPDRQAGHIMREFPIKNGAAQEALKNRFADLNADDRKRDLELCLSDTFDQAARLSAQYLREFGQFGDGSHSGTISFDTPITRGLKLQPVKDVYPLDIDGFPAWLTHGRVMEVTVNPDQMTVHVVMRPYLPEQYTDSADDILHNYYPPIAANPGGGAPKNVRIASLTEGQIKDNSGSITESINVEMTLPSGNNKPVMGRVVWKYRTEKLQAHHPGAEVRFAYGADTNDLLAGVQNEAIIPAVPFNPQSERIDVLVVPTDVQGREPAVRWVRTDAATEIEDAGGRDENDTSWIVTSPADPTLLAVGSAWQCEDEILTIIDDPVDNEDGTHTITVARGEHGTDAVAHAEATELRRVECSVAWASIVLTNVLEGLPAPSNLVVKGITDGIAFKFHTNLTPAQVERELATFRLYHSASPIPPDGEGATAIDLGKVSEGIDVPTVESDGRTYIDSQTGYYYRVSAVNVQGVESALSNQAGPEKVFAVTPPMIDGPPAPVVTLTPGGGGTLVLRAKRSEWLADIASCDLELYAGENPTTGDPAGSETLVALLIEDISQPFELWRGGLADGKYWGRARFRDSAGAVSVWVASEAVTFTSKSTSDTGVMDRNTINLGVIAEYVDNVTRRNWVKVAVAEFPDTVPSQADTAHTVHLMGAPEGQAAFDQDVGFSPTTIAVEFPYATLVPLGIPLDATRRWKFTAKVANAFGWSQFCDPVTFIPTLDPTLSLDEDVPSLKKFAVWTQEEQPTPPDPLITGLTVRFDGELETSNSNAVFEVVIETWHEKTFPEDDIALDQSDGIATAQYGSLAVTLSGLSSPVSANQFAGKGFRFGRHGAKNVGQTLQEFEIAACTTSPESSAPYSTVITLINSEPVRNHGVQAYWAVVNEYEWHKVGPNRRWSIPMRVTGQSAYPNRTFFSARHIVNVSTPLYFRARATGEFGSGPWRYATANDTGSTLASAATLKRTTGLQAGDIGNAQITGDKLADEAIDREGLIAERVVLAKHLTDQAKRFSLPADTFYSVDYRTVGWNARTIQLSDGTSFYITAGNTGPMLNKTFIYYFGGGFFTTTSYTAAVGEDRILVCTAWPTSITTGKAGFWTAIGTLGVTNENIAADSISGDRIQAHTISAREITTEYLVGLLLEAPTIRTAASGARIVLAENLLNFHGAEGNWVGAIVPESATHDFCRYADSAHRWVFVGDETLIDPNTGLPVLYPRMRLTKSEFSVSLTQGSGGVLLNSSGMLLRNSNSAGASFNIEAYRSSSYYAYINAVANTNESTISLRTRCNYSAYAPNLQITELGGSGGVILSIGGQYIMGLARDASGLRIGFFNASTPAPLKQTVTGSRGGNAALASLLAALNTIGLITNNTTE